MIASPIPAQRRADDKPDIKAATRRRIKGFIRYYSNKPEQEEAMLDYIMIAVEHFANWR